jgi:hypothetical protein
LSKKKYMTQLPNIKITHLKPNAQNVELWIAVDTNTDITVGHVFINIEPGKKLKLMDSWVHANYRKKGIYRLLWDTRWEYVNKHYRGYLIYAWCKSGSLPLLIEKGFDRGETVTYVEYKLE